MFSKVAQHRGIYILYNPHSKNQPPRAHTDGVGTRKHIDNPHYRSTAVYIIRYVGLTTLCIHASTIHLPVLSDCTHFLQIFTVQSTWSSVLKGGYNDVLDIKSYLYINISYHKFYQFLDNHIFWQTSSFT